MSNSAAFEMPKLLSAFLWYSKDNVDKVQLPFG